MCARHVSEVLKSGYLTQEERLAIDFERALEDNEEHMGEAAAMAVTCEQFDIEWDEHPHILIELPDGHWWEAEKLPTRGAL